MIHVRDTAKYIQQHPDLLQNPLDIHWHVKHKVDSSFDSNATNFDTKCIGGRSNYPFIIIPAVEMIYIIHDGHERASNWKTLANGHWLCPPPQKDTGTIQPRVSEQNWRNQMSTVSRIEFALNYLPTMADQAELYPQVMRCRISLKTMN